MALYNDDYFIDYKIDMMYAAAEAEEPTYDLGTCGGCGAYGKLGNVHNRKNRETGNFEECGEFV